jgi:NADPH-dependent 2,4-dienoyl-CoA reductase/sulfur reductase-like enzyme
LCRRHQLVAAAKRPRPNFAFVPTDFEVTLRGQRVVVVGGGTFGTMHALFALARGASVVHLTGAGGRGMTLAPAIAEESFL